MNLQDIENKYEQEMSDMEDAYIELVGKLEVRIKVIEEQNQYCLESSGRMLEDIGSLVAENERLKEQLVQETFANELLLKELEALKNPQEKTDINISP